MRSVLFIFLVSILCTDQLTTEHSIHSTPELQLPTEYSISEFPKIQDVERVLLEEEENSNKFQFNEKTVKRANILVISIFFTAAFAYLFNSIYNIFVEYKH